MIESLKSEFFNLCENRGFSKKEISLFKEAITFSGDKLSGEKRLSGNFALEHNLNIGVILVKAKMPFSVILAGLLYGLQNKVFPSDLEKRFSKDISDLVFGQTQLNIIRSKNKCTGAEVLRKIFLTSLNDPRVIFVKLAAKVDNLRTISFLPVQDQKRICQEVFDIYAPLANRFGLESIKRQLEDEAFKNINPKKYKEISDFLVESKEEREKFVKNFVEQIKDLIKDKVGVIKIKGRDKHLYSIYKKIIDRKVPLDKQKDHFAIRIVVKSVDDCYTALGILHEKFEPVEGALKDYISTPKPNGYKSLHTSVKLSGGKIVEVQIRTLEMDEESEEGVVAHWRYKHLGSDDNFEKKIAWLRSVLDLQNSHDCDDLLKTVKVNLFDDKIYCYTPKGLAVELPQGATVLDFAYQIHQDIGSHSVGGRINGFFAPLDKKLSAGDVVEVVTNKNQRPRRDWLKFVISSKAISKIRQDIKKFDNIPAPKRINILNKESDGYDSLVYSPGFESFKFVLAKCCNPLPEEKIVAVMKLTKVASVHNEECLKIGSVKNNLLPVYWKETFSRPLLIKVHAEERSGVLADILHTIVGGGFFVKEAKGKIVGNNLLECSFLIVPRELNDIVRLINRIRKVRGVKKIFFE